MHCPPTGAFRMVKSSDESFFKLYLVNCYIIPQLKVGISLCYPPAIMYLCLHCQQSTVYRQQSMVKDVRDLKDVRDPKDVKDPKAPKDSPSYKHLENHEL